MKKRRTSVLLLAAVLLTVLVSGGCAGNTQTSSAPETPASKSESQKEQEPVIEKKSAGDPSAPDESISYEKACQMINECGMEELYLPMSALEYQKLYFGTVEYDGEMYYSVYPYLTVGSKKIFVGSNYLVACDGEFVLNKHWFGEYSVVNTSCANDKSVKEMYPDAKITPNEALIMMAENEKSLGLDRNISDYLFEVSHEMRVVNGVPCYKITPKLEYYDRIDLLQGLYVAADGSTGIYRATSSSAAEFSQLVQE